MKVDSAPVNYAEGKKAREMVTVGSMRGGRDFLKHQAGCQTRHQGHQTAL